jgi:rubredoxin-NAD+ reductase
MSANQPVVIVGSGLAGYSLARELRKLAPDQPILLISEDAAEYYSKPMLSNAFGQKRTLNSLVTSTAAQMSEQLKIEVRTGKVASEIDPARRRITVDGDTIKYAGVILAVGARPYRLGQATEADGVHVVNSLDDYRRFRSRLDGCRRIVLLGAGFIGCEFANDLRASGIDVDIVDLAPHALARFWPAEMATEFQRRLAATGIRWYFDQRIGQVWRDGDETIVELAGGPVLHGDLVLSALGLAPRTELAQAAGLRGNRGIVVDAYLQTSSPGIFALGDCAEMDGKIQPFVTPIMHGARALARTLSGAATPIVFPPMPVVLKTPACPAVFLPPSEPGEWVVESDGDGIVGLCRNSAGFLVGVALLGAATARREEFVRRISDAQPKAAAEPITKNNESINRAQPTPTRNMSNV